MDEKRAREILGEIVEYPGSGEPWEDEPRTNFNGLGCVVWYHGSKSILIDETLDLERLETLVWWMQNKGPTNKGG